MAHNTRDPYELLIELMNLHPYRDGTIALCRTVDGCYLAQRAGDVGYNVFIGRPSAPHPGPGRDRMLETWRRMTPAERLSVVALARAGGNRCGDGTPIDLAREFGVPVQELAAAGGSFG